MSEHPARIGPYDVHGVLGSGSMGLVYRARRGGEGPWVAIKTVDVPRRRFLPTIRREIFALARLRHPGVVRILGHGLDGGVPWYAMELIEGPTLAAYCARVWSPTAEAAGAPPEIPRAAVEAIAAVARRLCWALAYVHGEGIVHCDLKPENVVVSNSAIPILVDFGLISLFGGQSNRENLEIGVRGTSGTIAYMAPEWLRGDLVDARADLYSLGCMLYQVLVGAGPFARRTTADVINAHFLETPKPPAELVRGIPDALNALVTCLLAKEPRHRVGYAEHVARTLETLLPERERTSFGPPPKRYLYRPRLLGRNALLSTLEIALQDLADRRGGVRILVGESGIGKTRLAMQVARIASRRDIRVLSGTCSVPLGTTATPLQPFRNVLQAIADRVQEGGERDAERLIGARGKILAAFEPRLRELPGLDAHPEPVDLPAEAARLRLFSCIAETLEKLSDERPVLLILDDLQWVDELSLNLILYLWRSRLFAKRGILLLGMCRPEEMSPELEAFARHPGIAQLTLQRLDEAAVGEMIADMLGSAAAYPALRRHLAGACNGNPFFIAEYLRAAIDAGLLAQEPGGTWVPAGRDADREAHAGASLAPLSLPLPGTLREVIARRLADLSPLAQRALWASAVIVAPLTAEVMAAVAELHPEAAEAALEELIRRHVLEESAAGSLAFCQLSIQEVAYRGMPVADVPAFHRAAALALQARHPEAGIERMSRLAEHWRRALEPDRAQEWYLKGAALAREVYALEEARRLTEAYLDLAAAVDEERAQTRLVFAEKVLLPLGACERARQQLQCATAEAAQLGDERLQARVMLALGAVHWACGERDLAAATCARALAAFRCLADKGGMAASATRLAGLCWSRGKLARADALLGKAAALLAELGDARAQAGLLNNRANVAWDRGELDVACDYYHGACTLQTEQGDLPGLGLTLANAALVLHQRGQLVRALQFHERALAIHRRVFDRGSEALTLNNIGCVYRDIGDPTAAAEALEQAIDLLQSTGNRRLELASRLNLARVRQGQGQIERARALLEQALAIARELDDFRALAAAACQLAMLERRATGELERSRVLVAQAKSVLRRLRAPRELVRCLCEEGHLELASGCSASAAIAEAIRLAAAAGVDRVADASAARELDRLRRAQEAFEAGQTLFRGELPDQ
ncbi:MAG: tetratricopeptide repeat protein [Candidatus Schekmanbacteria bacterium]|nr:tetratricopeptide repeat protein [Candidatus Schekmanbacteria bacterium]